MNNKKKYTEALELLKNKINSIENQDDRIEFLQTVNKDAEHTIASIKKVNDMDPVAVDMMWGMSLTSIELMTEIVDDLISKNQKIH